MTTQIVSTPGTRLPKSLDRLWQTLISPEITIQGEQRRRASILAAILIVLMPLAFFTVFTTPFVHWVNGQPLEMPTMPAFIAFIIVTIAYYFSRTRYYEIGAYLTIASPFLAVTGTIWASTETVSEIGLFFLALGIILSSLLLDATKTFISGIIAMVVIFFAYFQSSGDQPVYQFILIALFMFIASSVMSLISYFRDQYETDLIAARQALQEQIVIVEEARQRAERSDQVKSSFLASMSHELRTPLNAVINFTRFVIDGDTGPVNEEQAELLTEVVGSAKHLLNLINDVLDMSKIEAGSLNLFVEDGIDMNSLLNTAVMNGQSLIKGKDKPVELKTEIADDLTSIRGDRQRLLQILLNIVSNACKFTEEGEIRVKAYQKHDEIHIIVADTGPGITPEDQVLVFEAFKQTNTGLRQGGGTGLGMPIAKSLAEAHAGRMWLESEPGKGATFYVVLPVKSETLEPVLM
jgi:signal transduction histidine kinase